MATHDRDRDTVSRQAVGREDTIVETAATDQAMSTKAAAKTALAPVENETAALVVEAGLSIGVPLQAVLPPSVQIPLVTMQALPSAAHVHTSLTTDNPPTPRSTGHL